MCCRVRAGAGLVGVAFWRGYLFSSYQELTRVRGGGGGRHQRRGVQGRSSDKGI